VGFLKRTYNGRMKRINKRTKAEAITQILILVIGIIAISWMIGDEVKIVSAVDTGESCPDKCVGNMRNYEGLLNNVDECDYKQEICENGCSNGVCKTTTPTTSLCTLNFCGMDGNVYGSKRDATTGACVIDNAHFIKSCDGLGCSVGVCKPDTKSTTSNSEWQSTVSTISAIPTTIGTIKGLVGGGGKEAAATGTSSSLGTFLFGTETASGTWTGVGGGTTASTTDVLSSLGAIVIWAAIAFVVGRYLGEQLGLNTQQSQSLGYALAAGTIVGLAVTSDSIMLALGGAALTGPQGLAIGLVVAFITFIVLAKKSSVDVMQYSCSQWDAQNGRDLTAAQKKARCELCNEQKDLVCTEYQCRSLGQGCILINEESSGKQLCIWNNTQDINPPIIKPWEDALLDDFKYTPDNTISPPDRGVKIAYTGTESVTSDGNTKCAPAYTPISFGVQLDKPARCKINPLKLDNYSEMADVYMGRGIREYNQSFSLSLPSAEALEAENITVDNGGKYELYVRCEDANGNSNVGNFVFKFCINQGPDTTPPLIISTNILDGQPVAYGQKSINLDLYVNEPSECKWSYLDKDYKSMENNMTCATSVAEINSQQTYTCRGNLTGLKDSQDNKFYFRCKDQPNLKGTAKENNRNVNTQSFPLTLIGTRPLVIEKVGPKGIVEDSTDIVRVNLSVETAAGYDEGKAICSFSDSGDAGSYVDFFYGYDIEPFSQYQHSQQLGLGEGNYTYFIRCRDKGGNIDDANVSFSVKTDISSPIAVRVYKEENYLKLITDESGKCVYSNFGCTYLFNDGTEMTSPKEREYYTEWNINSDFYIKCEDNYGNQPLPNQCSIIARPFEIFQPK
jgi:hypothetical protein